MRKSIKRVEPENMKLLEEELRLRQSNILPPDIIANDRVVDDVLWNGPTGRNPVQRVGSFLIGSMLFFMGLVATVDAYEKGARILLTPFLVIAAAGLRVMYMSIKGRSVRKGS